MEPTKELIDELYREEIALARETPPAVKLLLGPQLFDRVRRTMEAGIRDQHPGSSDDRVRQILLERLRIARRLQQGWSEGDR
jgi:hypothetical protein